jgi:hypothetical protein
MWLLILRYVEGVEFTWHIFGAVFDGVISWRIRTEKIEDNVLRTFISVLGVIYKTGNVRITEYRDAFVQAFL